MDVVKKKNRDYEKNKEHHFSETLVPGFIDEKQFRTMLIFERKRTERSHKPVLLILLDVSKLYEFKDIRFTEMLKVKRVIQALIEFTRDVDIRGWYTHGTVIGILCTEFDGISRDSLCQKVKIVAEGALGTGDASKLAVTCHCFPEVDQQGNAMDQQDTIFYPENDTSTSNTYLLFKRGIDIAGSFLGLLLFSPLFVIIALLIKLDSRGPVFFKQKRAGYRGKPFTLLKFRSMHVNCDESTHREYVQKLIKGSVDSESSGSVYKITSDPRITRMGKILRKTSLDELPQFINVLIGDMSLVGPRPAIPYEIEQYDIWHRRRVQESKPGITGVWQVEGRSQTTFDGMVRMDLNYCRTRSLMVDLKLIMKTPVALLTTKGAY
ncbi:sugar transferase [Chitinispirillales bacterium ANBcel5]|uniref:sugar transferase n=1 Tax=Cellulosispirillum alkaliphilum TaxID=3039283 RepID=UPI002A525515|nr:sugar transferase [Chitinispirillales bacterium ANBcel5]